MRKTLLTLAIGAALAIPAFASAPASAETIITTTPRPANVVVVKKRPRHVVVVDRPMPRRHVTVIRRTPTHVVVVKRPYHHRPRTVEVIR